MFAYSPQLEGADTGDFEAINAAAFLLSTESSKTIFIAVKDDDLPEADETFTFTLKLQVKTHCVQVYMHVGQIFVCRDDAALLSGAAAFFPPCPTVLILPLTILNPNPQRQGNREWGRHIVKPWEALSCRAFDVCAP